MPTTPPASVQVTNLVYHLSKAQPKLPTVKLWVGAAEVDAELCLTIPQVSTGLMFRDSIGPSEGMLFVFGEPRRRAVNSI
jgi:hypothetical protein